MQPEESALVSLKRKSGIAECNGYISAMQSNVTAPFSYIEKPIKLNFAEAENVNLLPPSHFELFEQCGQKNFLPAEDFQLGYLPGECSRTRYQNLELPKWDVFSSNTCISNFLLNQQRQPVLEQQHLDESFVEQEAYYYPGLEKGNRQQLLEKISPVKIYDQPTGPGSFKKMRCKDRTLCSGKNQTRDAQWQLVYESMLNDCQSSASSLTPEDLSSAPLIGSHGMPMLPFDSHFSPSSTGLSSKKVNRQEDIVIPPNGLPAQLSLHDHEMMINSLPEKGKLLEAVLKAGPLLQTLLLAGPLPMWQRPPPDLDSSEIPLVPIAPSTPLMISPSNPPGQTLSSPNKNTGFTHKSPPEVTKTAYEKDPSLILEQSYPYSPLPLTPTSSSFKKRFMFMDDSLHNARSSLKHAKLQ
ncbi:hypothetical protein SUGI_0098710 [Cryptomeria japonica]|nr:hypothetical protein SUGI_0098710 [Cryptomeria japonica]